MVLGVSTGLTNQQLLQQTNHSRLSTDIAQLVPNSRLTAAAQAKAQDMASQNYWSHVGPDGSQPWSFVQQQRYEYQALGENLAYGFTDPSDVVKGWLNSPEHRANMLDPAYTNVGFGVVQAANFMGQGPETIVVAMYGRPASAVPLASQDNSYLPVRQVSRIDLVAANAVPGALYIVVAITAAAAGLFIYRHTRALHRVVAYSESFIVRHPGLDVVAVSLITIGALLTRNAGFIR